MKKVVALMLSIMIALLVMEKVSNACEELDYWTSDDITLAMGIKLARGVTNTATGWMEFPRAFYVTARDDGIGKSLVAGPFQGLFLTALRTLTGIFEVGTFLIPAPGCYDPFLDRPLVWSDVHQQEGVLIFNKDRRDQTYKKPPESKTYEESDELIDDEDEDNEDDEDE
jgi:putative exosortase-associated protein (TIGR04073 family)